MLSVWISLLLFCPAIVWTGNVLVVPVEGSHWVNMKIIVEELHSRGHSISVVRTSDSWYIKENSPFYTAITVKSESGFDEDFITELIAKLLEVQRNGRSPWARFKLEMEQMEAASVMHRKGSQLIEHMFEDKQLVQSLKDAKFDMVLTDPVILTGVMVARHLDLPLVFNVRWTTHGEGHFSIAPSPLSYVPVPGLEQSDKMSFSERVLNVVVYYFTQFHLSSYVIPHYEGLIQKYFSQDSFLSLFQRADLWLVASLPKEISEEIAAAFAELPQKVIWKHKGERPASLGNNTLLVDWMPQNDLLGHAKTKLFVAHGGTNGVQEAIYHGVPILGLPLIFDQHDNLFKIKFRGASKILNIFTIDRESFRQGIEEVIHEPSYRTNMERLSRLSRDLPMKPLDYAIFWIEYVIRNKGAGHLRSESYSMPWYSYHSVDVILLLLGVLLIMILTVVKTLCYCVCRRIKHKRD